MSLDGTNGSSQTRPLTWQVFVAFMAVFAGLCTIFALIVTAALAWQEHAEAQWPETTARIQRCGLDEARESYWIDCSLSYVVGRQEIVSHVRSLSTRAPDRVIWEYPPRQFDKLQEWVDAHPEGTRIAVHYDPANPKKAVLVATDMPRGGPQTPNNLKLLEGCAASCLILVTIVRIARPRSTEPGGPPFSGQE